MSISVHVTLSAAPHAPASQSPAFHTRPEVWSCLELCQWDPSIPLWKDVSSAKRAITGKHEPENQQQQQLHTRGDGQATETRMSTGTVTSGCNADMCRCQFAVKMTLSWHCDDIQFPCNHPTRCTPMGGNHPQNSQEVHANKCLRSLTTPTRCSQTAQCLHYIIGGILALQAHCTLLHTLRRPPKCSPNPVFDQPSCTLLFLTSPSSEMNITTWTTEEHLMHSLWTLKGANHKEETTQCFSQPNSQGKVFVLLHYCRLLKKCTHLRHLTSPFGPRETLA